MSNSFRVSPPERHRKGQKVPTMTCQEKENCHSAAPSSKSTLATLSQGTSASSCGQNWGYALLRKTNQGARRKKNDNLLSIGSKDWGPSAMAMHQTVAKSGKKSRNRLLKFFHMHTRPSSSISFPAWVQHALIASPPFPLLLQPLKSYHKDSLTAKY